MIKFNGLFKSLYHKSQVSMLLDITMVYDCKSTVSEHLLTYTERFLQDGTGYRRGLPDIGVTARAAGKSRRKFGTAINKLSGGIYGTREGRTI